MYLLDSNIYINFYDRYYKIDFFPTFWDKLTKILNEKVVIPRIVIDENYQDLWLKDWLSSNYNKSYINQKNYSAEWIEVFALYCNLCLIQRCRSCF